MNHPADELIKEISLYLKNNRNSLPVTQVNLLEQALDQLKHYRAVEQSSSDQEGLVHAAQAVYRLTEFLTDCDLPNASELLDAVQKLL
jgi:hypothetical protein